MSGYSLDGTSHISQINWLKKEYDGIDIRSYCEMPVFELDVDVIQPTTDCFKDYQLMDEVLEAKKKFEDGEIASYEEVFGHLQPGL